MIKVEHICKIYPNAKEDKAALNDVTREFDS